MGKAGKERRKMKKLGLYVETPKDTVHCSYCPQSGDPSEIYVSAENPDITVPEFFCEPRELTGNTEGLIIICRRCSLRMKNELKQRFHDWFLQHDLLPTVIATRECEKQYGEQAGPARAKAEELRDKHHVVPDSTIECSNCHNKHGDLVQTASLPKVAFRYVDVCFVEAGFYRDKKDVLARAICKDCEPEIQNKLYRLDKTLAMLADREETQRKRREALATKPAPQPVAPSSNVVPIRNPYEPKSRRGHDSREHIQAKMRASRH